MTTAKLAARRKAIHQRLIELTRQHSQSEIARKTGAPRNKVNRYVHGARIPCEFAAAMVDELGVNPAWLLGGTGTPELGEVKAGTVEIAGDLLELIRAMSAVEHMQLGALAGKHHLRILRELSDALARLEDIRARLNRQSTPLLRTLLDTMRGALDKPDLNAAQDLGRTARQLSRLCDDPDVLLDNTLLQSRLELQSHNLTEALELTRRAIMLTFHRSGQIGERELEAAVESIATLHGWHRFEEAGRVARGVLALAAVEARQLPVAHWLTALVADMRIQTGELFEGLRALPEVRGVLTGTRGRHTEIIMARGLLLSGAIDVSTAIGFGEDSRAKALRVLGIAVLMESEPELAQAVAYWESVSRSDESRWLDAAARLLLRALRGEKSARMQEQVHELIAVDPTDVGVANFAGPIMGAQIFRCMGNQTEARARFKDASRAIGRLPDWFTLGVMWEARHRRNALELGTKAQQRDARSWFRRHIDLGYRIFSRLLG